MEDDGMTAVERQEAERTAFLEAGSTSMREIENGLLRLENMGLGTPELQQARFRLAESLLWMKRSGHAGRWGE